MSLIPALAFKSIALASILAPLQIRRLCPRASAVLQAIGADAAATGRRIVARDALICVIERQRRKRHNDQHAKQAQAQLRFAHGFRHDTITQGSCYQFDISRRRPV